MANYRNTVAASPILSIAMDHVIKRLSQIVGAGYYGNKLEIGNGGSVAGSLLRIGKVICDFWLQIMIDSDHLACFWLVAPSLNARLTSLLHNRA